MLWLPAASVDVVNVACPLGSSAIMATTVAPSLNDTVPVVTGEPEAVTVAVNVTCWPKLLGFSDELTVVVVGACASAVPANDIVTSAAAIAASTAPRPHVQALAKNSAVRRGRTAPAARQSRPRMIGPPAGLREPFALR